MELASPETETVVLLLDGSSRLGDTHLVQPLPYGAYPRERLLTLGPYAEGCGQYNGAALDTECPL
jgi:hypothetical protein